MAHSLSDLYIQQLQLLTSKTTLHFDQQHYSQQLNHLSIQSVHKFFLSNKMQRPMIKNVHSTNQNTQIVTILQTVYMIFLPLIMSATLMARPLVTAQNPSQGHKTTEQRAKSSTSQSVSFTEKRKSQTEPQSQEE